MTKQFLCHLPSATDRRGNRTRRGPAIRWVCLLNPDIKFGKSATPTIKSSYIDQLFQFLVKPRYPPPLKKSFSNASRLHSHQFPSSQYSDSISEFLPQIYVVYLYGFELRTELSD